MDSERIDRIVTEGGLLGNDPMHNHVVIRLQGESEADHRKRCVDLMARRWDEERDIWTGEKLRGIHTYGTNEYDEPEAE